MATSKKKTSGGVKRGIAPVSRAGAKKSAVKKPAAKKTAAAKKPAVKKTVAKQPVPKKAVRVQAPLRKPAVPRPGIAVPQPVTGEIPDSVRIEGRKIYRTREERRRQVLAVLISLMLIILALLLINRQEGLEKVQKLQKDARQSEQAGDRDMKDKKYDTDGFRKGIRKLDAALRILDRIQNRINPEKKELHKKLDGVRAAVRDDLKRLLLKEADRLQKLARQLDADGQDDKTLGSLKQAGDALKRLTVEPWDKDRKLQDRVGKLLDRLEKDMKSLGLKNEEVDRLLKRARQDEDDGLYDDALKKLDKVLDLLDKLERDLRNKPPEERQAWKSKIDSLRNQVRNARRRIDAKRRDRDRQQTRNDPSDDAERRRLADQNRRLQDALNKRDGQKDGRSDGRSGMTGAGGNRLQPKDIKTGVKDVQIKGKDKVGYDKSAGIEKD